MLGAVTDDGDRFVCLTRDRFTATVCKYFLRALQYEFGEKLAVILDNAPYFIAKDLKKQAAADGLLLIYLPPHSPELNPLEQCWEQLQRGRADQLFLTVRDVERYLKFPYKNLERLRSIDLFANLYKSVTSRITMANGIGPPSVRIPFVFSTN